jgi:signal transduction histidine kinase
VIIRLLLNEKCLGLLFLNFRRTRTFSEWDKKRYLSFAHLAALAIQKMQLQQHIVQREKNELSNYIHDMLIGDTLGLFKILNSVNQALYAEKEPSEKISNNMSLAIKATENLHNDIRWINRLLKESTYDDLMLELDRLFLMFKQVFNVTAETHWTGDMGRIPPVLARELFIVFKEAMTNSVRHGKAKTITFTGALKSNELSTVIADDGIGFDQRTVKHKNGLLSMKYRIEEMGGIFDISSNPGRGTRISLKVPILHTSEVQDGKNKQ